MPSCTITGGGTPQPACMRLPATVPDGGGSVSVPMVVITPSQTPPGTYRISVSATDANNVAPSNGGPSLTLVVMKPVNPSYSLSAGSLTPASVSAGTAAASILTVTPSNNFTGSVAAVCTITGGGTPPPACLPPPLIVPAGSGPISAPLGVTTSSLTPSGTYSISVSGRDANGLTSNGPQSLTLVVTKPANPSYTLSAGAFVPGTVNRGGAATATITIAPSNGYNYSGIVAVNCNPTSTPPLPCMPAIVTVSNGSGSGKVVVGTSSQTPAGTYVFSIAGADGNGLRPSNGAQSLTLVVH